MTDTKDPDYIDEDTDDQDDKDLDYIDGLWKEDLKVSKKAKTSKKKSVNDLCLSTLPKLPSQTNLDNQARSLLLSAGASTSSTDGLSIKRVTLDDVFDSNLLSEEDKKGLSKMWNEYLNESRGIRPLDEFEGKDEKQKCRNRTITHYETGCKGIGGNKEGHPLGVILTRQDQDEKWGVPCFEAVEEGILCNVCNTVLKNTMKSTKLAVHAARCKAENNTEECKCCGENNFPNDREKHGHFTVCNSRLETLLEKLEQLRTIHSLDPTSKQAMLDGDKTKWFMAKICKDYTLEEMKAMNDEQNHPLGASDSPEAIATMNDLRKAKFRRSIWFSVRVALGLGQCNQKSKKYGGLIKAALNDFGFVSTNYPMNQ